MSELTCPLCQNKVPELSPLDANLKSRILAETGQIMENICAECLEKFTNVTERRKGAVYSKEQQRLTLWRSRIQLIREARDRFMAKDYAGSVIAYEKYFKIIEIIYDVKITSLKAEEFANPGRAKEMAVMTTAFWDMVRIFDLSGKQKPRLDLYAQKLGEFLPHTPLHGEVLAKLAEYRSHAKNKDVFEKLYRTAKRGKSKRCFIATASFQSPFAPEVIVLSRFRDEVLETHVAGRAFISTYYLLSPYLAKLIDHQPSLQKISRSMLSKMAEVLSAKYNWH